MFRPRRKDRGDRSVAGLLADQSGQVTLEWALILAAVAIPMVVVFAICLRILIGNYRMAAFLNSMPFP